LKKKIFKPRGFMRLNYLKLPFIFLVLAFLISCSSSDEITKKKDEALSQKGNVSSALTNRYADR